MTAVFLGTAMKSQECTSSRVPGLHRSPALIQGIRNSCGRVTPCLSQNSKTFLQSYLNENWMR